MYNTIQVYTPQTNSESPLSSILSTPGLTLEKLPHEQPEPLPPRHTPDIDLAAIGSLGIQILEHLDFLSNLQRKRSPSGARYCYPGEKYLAQRFNVARETISRCISRLANLGVLQVTHRRKRAGRWQTNLYRILDWRFWRYIKLMRLLGHTKRRVTKTSHKEVPKRDNNELILPKRIGDSARALLETWMKRGETQKDAA